MEYFYLYTNILKILNRGKTPKARRSPVGWVEAQNSTIDITDNLA